MSRYLGTLYSGREAMVMLAIDIDELIDSVISHTIGNPYESKTPNISMLIPILLEVRYSVGT